MVAQLSVTKNIRMVFLDAGTFKVDVRNSTEINRYFPTCEYYSESSAAEVASRIRDVEIIITNKVPLNKNAIQSASKLKLIAVAATGYDNIDLNEAARRGVVVSNVRGYANQSVAQHVFMLALTLARRFVEYRDLIACDAWNRSNTAFLMDYDIHDLTGRNFGIVGYGQVGREVARVARCFGMEVLVSERKGCSCRMDRVSFEEVLARADILSIHCPLNEETRRLIGKSEFEMMKKTAILINTARGGIVNEADLYGAICDGLIAGAGIDVLSEEPPSSGNVLLDARRKNLIVTPHIAWASIETQQRLLDQTLKNILCFLRGKPRNVVMPSDLSINLRDPEVEAQ